jgi:phosphoribosyl-ATP pyrophosphohydrolase
MRCIDIEGDYLVLQGYGKYRIRVKPEICREFPDLEFAHGDFVRAYDKTIRYGLIALIDWHYQRNEPIYHLIIGGKPYKKRYFTKNLTRIVSAEEKINMTDMLNQLEAIIADRKANPKEESYTASLFAKGRPKIAQKVGEEATEVIVAALAQSREEQIGELSDLFYHTLVLMADLGISLDDVKAELEKRHR